MVNIAGVIIGALYVVLYVIALKTRDQHLGVIVLMTIVRSVITIWGHKVNCLTPREIF